MLTPSLSASLTKQGYKLFGSHSGVKLCRWTKAMLRGRGGCYKHTFYGITSYQCMEMTPSLACANKCVFCWRHHKNPVGTEWKWQTDPPDFLIENAIKEHQKMINQLKGVPGVIPQRYATLQSSSFVSLSFAFFYFLLSNGPHLLDLSIEIDGKMLSQSNTALCLLLENRLSTLISTNLSITSTNETSLPSWSQMPNFPNKSQIFSLLPNSTFLSMQPLKKVSKKLIDPFLKTFGHVCWIPFKP